MQDVTKDRDKYIGGSDIAAILNISKFKTRWQLLKEKAGVEESDFTGNVYTEYGNVLEPQIRDYINAQWSTNFVEGKIINGYLRYHADGVDYAKGMLLEIKTTSTIHEDVKDYDYYLCQLLMGIEMYGYEDGILAVYERPEDFDEEFNSDRLTVYNIKKSDYSAYIEHIKEEVERFRADWMRLKENPLTTEEDLQPKEVVDIVNKVINLEAQLTLFKEIESEWKEAKAGLKNTMEKYYGKNPCKFETINGIKVSFVPDREPVEKWEFDTDKFAAENAELYKQYLKKVTKKGKAGYVRITAGSK